MKLMDYITHVQTVFNSGVPSDDKKLSDEHIYHLLKTARVRLLYEKQNKMYKISDRSFQHIPCLKLEEGYLAECHCLPPGCAVLMSCELPTAMSWRNNIIMHVTTMQGETIPQISLKKSNYLKYKKVQLNKYGWFIHNNRLVVVGDTRLCLVSVNFIAEDPLELTGINHCNTEGEDLGIPCYDPTTDEFPIDAELVDIMYKLVFEDLKLMYGLPNDNENNAKSVEGVQGKE